MIANLTAANKVHAAITAGARTQKEILRKTRLPEDQVADSIAYLLLTVRMIRTETDDYTRFYFPTTDRTVFSVVAEQSGSVNDTPDSALSFSTMRGLMPRTQSFRC
jgi:hypothetical protein